MLHMGKAIRNVIQFVAIITLVLTGADVVLIITGQNGFCFVSLAIAIVLLLWGYRARGIAQRAFSNPVSVDRKKKDKGNFDDGFGPFAPEDLLTSIPENTYFLRLAHSEYQPGVTLFVFGDLGEGCAPDWVLEIPVLAVIFRVAWGSIYGVFMLALDHSLDRIVFWVTLICLALPGAWFLLAFSGQWHIDWSERGKKGRFEDDSVPLFGTILNCEREFEEVQNGVTHHY